jgi:hypothetical protein
MGGYIPFHKKLGCSVRFSWAALGLVEGGRKRANQRYRPRLRAFPPLLVYHWLLVQLVLIEEFALHCSHEE